MIKPTTQRAKALLGSASLIAATIGLSGCININTGFDGVPLSEVDMGGDAPVEIALAGPDDVFLTVGDTLDIQVEGDDEVLEDLRFRREGDALKIGRESDWNNAKGKAIIRVTMPPPSGISLAGSGNLDAKALAKSAEISIAGSGKVDIETIDADDLDISIAGAGSLSGTGTATALDISIAGSGDIEFAGVTADDVEISIAGSGDIELASDGKVEASIAGSGDVKVTGNATCNSRSVGSGNVTCTPAAASAQAKPEEDDAEADAE